ncbi:hypothetical protein [Paenimyroides aestuarii]|uniref:Uncharacterized protein n=1 Tax=Paenimyroides aestuarii TaxID=2968490 RepID=A0ABY5NRY7_9FLAO|nr:hypothetical protein [Paenimyroides aestuarii]UUV21326.1 hypothetical protein NPX36_13500 [Paenimyroides aestuarii]
MKKIVFFMFLCINLYTLNAQELDSKLEKISGKYVGEFTAFKYNNGQTEETVSWKDTVTTSAPIATETSAYMNVTSEMVFNNPHIPPYKMQFKEGFEQLKNEEIKHFIEVMGTKFYQIEVPNNTFIISQPISKFELSQLGFTNAKEAYHTTVKVVVNKEGQEVHNISRISTIKIDNDGKEEIVQFLSMKGHHTKIE